MNVEEQNLIRMFQKIDQLRNEIKQYMIAPDKIPVSVDDLCDVVRRMYGVEIEVREVAAPGKFLRGTLLLYNTNGQKKACILVRAGQTDDWKRFTVAKELSQIVLDEEEDYSTDAVVTITGLMHSLQLDMNGEGDYHPDTVVLNERLSELCAMEFLYPAEFHERDYSEIERGGLNYRKLALRWKIPIVAAGWAHQADYRAACKECRGR